MSETPQAHDLQEVAGGGFTLPPSEDRLEEIERQRSKTSVQAFAQQMKNQGYHTLGGIMERTNILINHEKLIKFAEYLLPDSDESSRREFLAHFASITALSEIIKGEELR